VAVVASGLLHPLFCLQLIDPKDNQSQVTTIASGLLPLIFLLLSQAKQQDLKWLPLPLASQATLSDCHK